MELPEVYINVMITYKATISSGPYGDTKSIETVTRRAFYSKSDGFYNAASKFIKTPNGYFNVPQNWSWFTTISGKTSLEPQGLEHYARVYPNEIIKWEYDKSSGMSNKKD